MTQKDDSQTEVSTSINVVQRPTQKPSETETGTSQTEVENPATKKLVR